MWGRNMWRRRLKTRERNKDDITHVELLEKHYKEREKAHDV